MVEGARLESVYTGNCFEGSNPFLSAMKNEVHPRHVGVFYAPIRFRDFSPEGEEGHKKDRAL